MKVWTAYLSISENHTSVKLSHIALWSPSSNHHIPVKVENTRIIVYEVLRYRKIELQREHEPPDIERDTALSPVKSELREKTELVRKECSLEVDAESSAEGFVWW